MRKLAGTVTVAMLAGLLTVVPASAVTAEETLDWSPCYQELGAPFECATTDVPLDHDEPERRTIRLAMARLPATHPHLKLGTIFLNPGGPGGSGVDFVLGAGPLLFSPLVRAYYDLVGFDPRGILRSNQLRCFRTQEEAFTVLSPWAFPLGPQEEAIQAALDLALEAACAARSQPIAEQMSTADVARDLDVLRELVGDEQLNYYGASYGSHLGTVYANLFPDNVGAVVVDAILDPIAWTTGRGDEADTLPFSTRLGSDVGAQDTLNEFFRLCDEAGPNCDFSGDSEARFAAMAEKLLVAPIPIIDPISGEPFLLTYADLIGVTWQIMYNSAGWPFLASLLAAIEAQVPAAVVGESFAAAKAAAGFERGPNYDNFVEGFVGVACSDSDNPDGHEFWSIAGAEADEAHGYFGRPWTWASSPCAVWSATSEDRYTGPWDNVTANTVLIIGNLYDPATPYSGALVLDDLMPNSALLTLDGWGHTSLFLSRCVDFHISRYFLTGRTPRPGAVCQQSFGPFDQVPVSAEDAARQQTRLNMMPDVAYRPPGVFGE